MAVFGMVMTATFSDGLRPGGNFGGQRLKAIAETMWLISRV